MGKSLYGALDLEKSLPDSALASGDFSPDHSFATVSLGDQVKSLLSVLLQRGDLTKQNQGGF